MQTLAISTIFIYLTIYYLLFDDLLFTLWRFFDSAIPRFRVSAIPRFRAFALLLSNAFPRVVVHVFFRGDDGADDYSQQFVVFRLQVGQQPFVHHPRPGYHFEPIGRLVQFLFHYFQLVEEIRQIAKSLNR